jgi:hypothetical protein
MQRPTFITAHKHHHQQQQQTVSPSVACYADLPATCQLLPAAAVCLPVCLHGAVAHADGQPAPLPAQTLVVHAQTSVFLTACKRHWDNAYPAWLTSPAPIRCYIQATHLLCKLLAHTQPPSCTKRHVGIWGGGLQGCALLRSNKTTATCLKLGINTSQPNGFRLLAIGDGNDRLGTVHLHGSAPIPTESPLRSQQERDIQMEVECATATEQLLSQPLL